MTVQSMSRPVDVDLSTSVLARAFTVLDCLPTNGGGITLTQLSELTGVPKGSLHRMLAQLVALEVLRREEDRYHLGRHLFSLTRCADPDVRLREAALPHMVELHEQTRATIHLGVLDGVDVLYVERLGKTGRTNYPTRIGHRMPAYCTGLGKAMLAYSRSSAPIEQVIARGLVRRTPRTISMPGIFLKELRRTREDGHACDREEAFVGLNCLAAPIMDDSGPIAAMSLSMNGSAEQNSRNVNLLINAAQQITRSLRSRRAAVAT